MNRIVYYLFVYLWICQIKYCVSHVRIHKMYKNECMNVWMHGCMDVFKIYNENNTKGFWMNEWMKMMRIKLRNKTHNRMRFLWTHTQHNHTYNHTIMKGKPYVLYMSSNIEFICTYINHTYKYIQFHRIPYLISYRKSTNIH
jgi:hypothetical protein